MIALITLVLPTGGDAGPFNLLSNIDGYTIPFEVNVPTASLVAGYTSIYVPDGTTIIRVMSIGRCDNYIDIQVNLIPTTTTTSSSSTSTSTSTSSTSTSTTSSTSTSSTSTTSTTSTTSSTTTSTSSTTTTTTTFACTQYIVNPLIEGIHTVDYINCDDSSEILLELLPSDTSTTICVTEILSDSNPSSTDFIGGCTPTPPLEGCYKVTFSNASACQGSPGHYEITWTDCEGNVQFSSIPIAFTYTVCALFGPGVVQPPESVCSSATVSIGTPCSLLPGTISATSNTTNACGIPRTINCWVLGVADVNLGSIVYLDASGTIPFTGDSHYYNLKLSSYPNGHNSQINSFGYVSHVSGLCP